MLMREIWGLRSARSTCRHSLPPLGMPIKVQGVPRYDTATETFMPTHRALLTICVVMGDDEASTFDDPTAAPYRDSPDPPDPSDGPDVSSDEAVEGPAPSSATAELHPGLPQAPVVLSSKGAPMPDAVCPVVHLWPPSLAALADRSVDVVQESAALPLHQQRQAPF